MKEQEVPLNATVRRSLAAYLEGMDEVLPTDFLQSKRRTPLSVRAAQHMIHNLAKRADIERIVVSAHTLRHTFAVHYLKHNPGKLVEWAALLGYRPDPC